MLEINVTVKCPDVIQAASILKEAITGAKAPPLRLKTLPHLFLRQRSPLRFRRLLRLPPWDRPL